MKEILENIKDQINNKVFLESEISKLELENINPEDIVEKEVLLLKFKLVYEISKKENQTESTEGSFTVKQEDDKGIIETTPNKGYIVEDVIVTDSKDEEVPVTK